MAERRAARPSNNPGAVQGLHAVSRKYLIPHDSVLSSGTLPFFVCCIPLA